MTNFDFALIFPRMHYYFWSQNARIGCSPVKTRWQSSLQVCPSQSITNGSPFITISRYHAFCISARCRSRSLINWRFRYLINAKHVIRHVYEKHVIIKRCHLIRDSKIRAFLASTIISFAEDRKIGFLKVRR